MVKKILVVDDEPGIVDIVETWLTANGYEVYTAYAGEEGLKKCKMLKPDAVLLDIMMPDIDGASVAEEIKEDPNLSHIPVIFLTGAVRSSEVPESNIVGGQYFLAKPFNKEQLLKIVRQVLLGY
jgi:two-component system, OmpR family, alkaline phosphatase synthesis response regulator PhoP